MTPHIVAASPEWKLATVLQMEDVAPRSSTEERFRPAAAGEEVRASPTVEHVGAAASRNCIVAAASVKYQPGVETLMFRLSVLVAIYSLVNPLTGPV